MNHITIIYRACFTWFDGTVDLDSEAFDSDAREYDCSDDIGQYGQVFECALDVFKDKIKEPKEGGTYVVLLAGKLVFTSGWTECGYEYDSHVEVEWAHASAVEAPPNQNTEDFVFENQE